MNARTPQESTNLLAPEEDTGGCGCGGCGCGANDAQTETAQQA